jgi:predicted enzyme related to lactoylglutathione lyase
LEEAGGGSIVSPKQEILGMGGVSRDTEGNTLWLWENA